MDAIEQGRRAEALCAHVLERAGLSVMARNFRCRMGEVDLIAREGATLVFCEVRLRRGQSFGGAAESITAAKRGRIVAAARFYLAGKPESDCRFDVMLLDGLEMQRVRWIRDAFRC
jgi:putative endonuclease